MQRYTTALRGVSPTMLGVSRVADVIAAMTPPSASDQAVAVAANTPGAKTAMTAVNAAAPPKMSVFKAVTEFVGPSLLGSIAGAYFWKEHRVLGFLAGGAAGACGYEFYKGDKKKAATYLAIEGAAVLASLKYPKHPALAFTGGLVAASVIANFVPGSPTKGEFAKLKAVL